MSQQSKTRRARCKRFDHQMAPIGVELSYEQYAKRRHWDRIEGFNHAAMKAALTAFNEIWRGEMRRMCERENIVFDDKYDSRMETTPKPGLEPPVREHRAISDRNAYIDVRSRFLACASDDSADLQTSDLRAIAAAEFDARIRPGLRLVHSRD